MTDTLSFRAALLDMDGTLVDSRAVVERLWREWSDANGMDWPLVLRTIHGRQAQQSMATLLPDRPHQINIDEGRRMLAQESVQTDGVVEIPGAAVLLRALVPFPHAIVTSADQRLMTARMTAAGLTVPAHTVTAEHVSHSKPDPEGFLRGAALLGIDPADCVVFEDSEAGVQAGLAAGMTVIGVGTHAAAHGPHRQVDDLTRVSVSPVAAGFALTLR